MLQDLQSAILLCAQELHIQISHWALSRLLVFFPNIFVEKLYACCGCCGCVPNCVRRYPILHFCCYRSVTAV